MRALGLDLGTKRIGVAVSDTSGTIASPLTTIHRAKSANHDHAAIAALALEEEVEIIVVGLPLRMDGGFGPAAIGAQREAERIGTVVSVPVVLFDERMTTVAADRALREADISASRRRQHVDRVAAAVMLQAWLDRGRPA